MVDSAGTQGEGPGAQVNRQERLPGSTVPFSPPALSSMRFQPNRALAALLARPGLLERLRGWRAHRLTLITAPAGYGKTTLAASALHDALDATAHASELAAGHALWLGLSDDDAEPASFVFALGAALAPLLPEAAESAARILFGRNDPKQAFQLLLVAVEAVEAPVLIVLDDFHRAQSEAVRKLITIALEQGPANLHWMLTARHLAPLPLGRLRLLGQMLEIDVDDLRLSLEEIEAYLHHAGVEGVDGQTVALLEEHTQGWIAGLQLALLSLQRGGRKQARNAHALRHLQGNNALLDEYLTGEVLAQLPEPLRTFLLESSILERLHPELCTAVTGVASSRALLQEATTQQLFLRQAEDDDEWYVMHQLFRDLLLRRLKIEQSSEAVQALHRRAADWFLARDSVTEAVRALLAGNAPHLAAEVVQNRTRPALLEHRLADVRHWIHLLPAEVVDERIPLLLDLGWGFWAGSASDLDEAMLRLRRALAMAQSQALAAGRQIPCALRDEAAALELLHRYVTLDHNTLIADALATEANFAPESHHARGWAFLIAVLCNNSRELDRLATASRALAAFRAADYPRGELYVHGWQTTKYTLLGNAEAAMESCRSGLEIAVSQRWPDPSDPGFFSMILGETLYWLDRIDEARAAFRQMLADAQRYHLTEAILNARAFLDLCDIAQGRTPAFALPEARAEEERLCRQFEEEGYLPNQRAVIALHYMARERLLGNPAGAWSYLQRLGIQPDSLNDADYPTVALTVQTAKVTRGKYLEGLSERLDGLIEEYRTTDKPIYALRLQILRVRQLQMLGQRDAARSLLRQLLHEVERTGYVRLILDEPALAPLLRIAYTDFAQALAIRMEQSPALLPHPELSDQQMAVLRLLPEKLSMKEMAARLVISPNTLKWHLTRIYARLGVENRRQAITAAHNFNLLND